MENQVQNKVNFSVTGSVGEVNELAELFDLGYDKFVEIFDDPQLPRIDIESFEKSGGTIFCVLNGGDQYDISEFLILLYDYLLYKYENEDLYFEGTMISEDYRHLSVFYVDNQGYEDESCENTIDYVGFEGDYWLEVVEPLIEQLEERLGNPFSEEDYE